MRSALGAAAALALVPLSQAWNIQLPPCLDDFEPFVSSGCFEDGNSPALIYRSTLDQNQMTIEKCVADCKGNGFRYAGLKYYGVCYCGATVDTPQIEDSKCSLPCSGNNKETCGGNNAISIWQDTTFPKAANEVTVDDYVSLGCYTDDSSQGRTLSYPVKLDEANLSTKQCLAACQKQGFPLAGTEFGGECWCGVVLGYNTAKVDDKECNMPCKGDSADTCGGRARLNVYVAKELKSLQPCGSRSGATTSSRAVVTSTSQEYMLPINPTTIQIGDGGTSSQKPATTDVRTGTATQPLQTFPLPETSTSAKPETPLSSSLSTLIRVPEITLTTGSFESIPTSSWQSTSLEAGIGSTSPSGKPRGSSTVSRSRTTRTRKPAASSSLASKRPVTSSRPATTSLSPGRPDFTSASPSVPDSTSLSPGRGGTTSVGPSLPDTSVAPSQPDITFPSPDKPYTTTRKVGITTSSWPSRPDSTSLAPTMPEITFPLPGKVETTSLRPGTTSLLWPSRPDTTSLAPVGPGTTSLSPSRPDTTSLAPFRPDTTSLGPSRPDTTSLSSDRPDTSSLVPSKPKTTSLLPDQGQPDTSFPGFGTTSSRRPYKTTKLYSTPVTTVSKKHVVTSSSTRGRSHTTTQRPAVSSSLAPSKPDTTSLAPGLPVTSSLAPGLPDTTSLAPGLPDTTSLAPGLPDTTSRRPFSTSLAPSRPETTSQSPVRFDTTSLAPSRPDTTSLAPSKPDTSSRGLDTSSSRRPYSTTQYQLPLTTVSSKPVGMSSSSKPSLISSSKPVPTFSSLPIISSSFAPSKPDTTSVLVPSRPLTSTSLDATFPRPSTTTRRRRTTWSRKPRTTTTSYSIPFTTTSSRPQTTSSFARGTSVSSRPEGTRSIAPGKPDTTSRGSFSTSLSPERPDTTSRGPVPATSLTTGKHSSSQLGVGTSLSPNPRRTTTLTSRIVRTTTLFTRPAKTTVLSSNPIKPTTSNQPGQTTSVSKRPVVSTHMSSKPYQATVSSSRPVNTVTFSGKPSQPTTALSGSSGPVESTRTSSRPVRDTTLSGSPVKTASISISPSKPTGVSSRPVGQSTVSSRPVESSGVSGTPLKPTWVSTGIGRPTTLSSSSVKATSVPNGVGQTSSESGQPIQTSSPGQPTSTTKDATVSTTAPVCTVTNAVPSKCEWQRGGWCAPALPEWSNKSGCLAAARTCALQVASCFKYAGWPHSMDCFDFQRWCGDVQQYCQTCNGGNNGACGKDDCWKRNKPSFGTPPVKTTSVIPCSAASPSAGPAKRPQKSASPANPVKPAKPADSVKPAKSAEPAKPAKPSKTACSAAPTNICKQPKSQQWGYGPGKPVAGIPMPVVGCNDVKEDWQSNPYKLYTEPKSSKCPSFKWPQRSNPCMDSCRAQLQHCRDTYVNSAKRLGSRTGYRKRDDGDADIDLLRRSLWTGNTDSCAASGNPYSWSKSGSDAPKCWGWGGNTADLALQRCKAQYSDCVAVNKKVRPGSQCKSWCSGKKNP
ncbi:hypothetical protein HIM_06556 [Hirsutella minnesotensis 3608]|uniref:WSC domain-containing protein n=1 Tax=Hirsutella minnesotensis 3608 TaxID=1043627 RepID=A0A0F7ZZF0_9HYPO|nr:hypothetical protein HIM_06556 [Hirsutella minnesotensis 3608]